MYKKKINNKNKKEILWLRMIKVSKVEKYILRYNLEGLKREREKVWENINALFLTIDILCNQWFKWMLSDWLYNNQWEWFIFNPTTITTFFFTIQHLNASINYTYLPTSTTQFAHTYIHNTLLTTFLYFLLQSKLMQQVIIFKVNYIILWIY